VVDLEEFQKVAGSRERIAALVNVIALHNS
jgi:hypothetical protein